jgi:hypothetical protein
VSGHKLRAAVVDSWAPLDNIFVRANFGGTYLWRWTRCRHTCPFGGTVGADAAVEVDEEDYEPSVAHVHMVVTDTASTNVPSDDKQTACVSVCATRNVNLSTSDGDRECAVAGSFNS